jgi:hypothetical protein
MNIKKYTFDNGKYEVQAADDGSSLKAYRYGEFWQNMIGDNLTAALVNRIDELEKEVEESRKADECWNAVISYMLGKGYMESPLEFLRCWNEGNFDALREEWPDAPEEIYLADPLGSNTLYKGEK